MGDRGVAALQLHQQRMFVAGVNISKKRFKDIKIRM